MGDSFVVLSLRLGLQRHPIVPNCSDVPAVQGVYVVLHEGTEAPVFLKDGTGGAFKGKNPNSDISKLKANWVEDTQIVYIGMTQDTLKKRLCTYMRFGQGEAVGHFLKLYSV